MMRSSVITCSSLSRVLAWKLLHCLISPLPTHAASGGWNALEDCPPEDPLFSRLFDVKLHPPYIHIELPRSYIDNKGRTVDGMGRCQDQTAFSPFGYRHGGRRASRCPDIGNPDAVIARHTTHATSHASDRHRTCAATTVSQVLYHQDTFARCSSMLTPTHTKSRVPSHYSSRSSISRVQHILQPVCRCAQSLWRLRPVSAVVAGPASGLFNACCFCA